MYAMQYELSLPADYDLGIIRRRAEAGAALTDDFEGLGLKAYLVQDQASGASVNQYAPFYLWNDPAAMGRFLWGGGFFTRICQSFGRPVVRHWTGVETLAGPAVDQVATAATKHTEHLAPDVDPAGPVNDALADLRQRAAMPGVHSAALAVDPTRWELVRFTLWSGEPGDATGTRYEVVRLSTPGTKALFGG